MKNLKTFLLLAVFAFVFTACDNDDDPKPLTKDEMLRAKSWRLTGETTTDQSGQAQNTYDGYQPCEKDNLYKFMQAGKLVVDEGPTKCDPNDPQTSDGTWSLNNDQLTIQDPGFPFALIFNIAELTSTKLVLNTSFAGATFTQTFTAQ